MAGVPLSQGRKSPQRPYRTIASLHLLCSLRCTDITTPIAAGSFQSFGRLRNPPNDFAPVVGHRFSFRSTPMHGWNGVTDCEVLELLPLRRLVYSWNASGDQAADGLKTIVTWTLEPISTGTRVRMEQSGFRQQDEMGFKAMGGGWPRILGQLEAEAAMAQFIASERAKAVLASISPAYTNARFGP